MRKKGSGSIPPTNGSGSGTGRPKNMQILTILRILSRLYRQDDFLILSMYFRDFERNKVHSSPLFLISTYEYTAVQKDAVFIWKTNMITGTQCCGS
jgi:hypothetical protein